MPTDVLGYLKSFCVVGCACFLLTTLAATDLAQTQQPAPRQPRRAAPVDDYEITARIAEAMRLLSTAPTQSRDILELLDRQFPGNERVLSRLGYVYQVTGQETEAESAYRKAIAVNPRGMEATKALGVMYYTKGRDAEGRKVFNQLIIATDYSMSAYKVVGGALRDLGRYDEAIEFLNDGRNRDKRNEVLTLEIADLYRQIGDPDAAIGEYLHYVDAQPRNYRFARDRILETLRAAGARRGDVIRGLEARVATPGGNRFVLLDVLAAHYIESGNLEHGLDLALQADAEPGSDGTVLLALADQIVTEVNVRPNVDRVRYLQLGQRALDAFTDRHPKQPGTDRAMHMLATIHVEFARGGAGAKTASMRREHLEKAAGTWAELAHRYPNSEFAEIAWLERGDVLLYSLKRPKEALDSYRNGAVNSRGLGETFASRIGDVYLGTGDVAGGRRYFEHMIDSAAPALVQTGYFYTGLTFAIEGAYTEAVDTLTFLAEADPSAAYANDAIEVAWIVQEALQYESRALDDWFSAVQASMVGDTTKVLAHLDAIVELPVYETLRPRALFWQARLLYGQRDDNGALAACRRFLREYEDEELRPDVQRYIATVYEFGLSQFERALAEYETVLVEYPEYAFQDEVRKDVRRLRYIVKGESFE